MKQKGIGTSAVVATIVIIIAIAGVGGYFALKGGEEIKEGEGEEGAPEPAATGKITFLIYNNDYAYYDVKVYLNGELMAHASRFANGFWGPVDFEPYADNNGPYVVTGSYELRIEADGATKTFTGTVGDEATTTYHIGGTTYEDTVYIEGVWWREYRIVIEGGDIGLHY